MRSFTEVMYWNVKRPAHRLFLSFVWALPTKVVYWCVVRAAVKVEPNANPSGVTAEQMLERLDKP